MKICCLLVMGILISSCVSRFEKSFEITGTTNMRWYKGNTHAHSSRSVGNASAIDVATWYKTNGYQFLVLTDDRVPSDSALISKMSDATFLLIPGMEIKSYFGAQWIHTNGLNAAREIDPQEADTLLNTLQIDIDNVIALKGVPQINHPKFKGGADKDTILKSRNCNLIEVYNGYVGPKDIGKTGYLDTELDWDYILTAGKSMFGIASDDANTFPGNSGGYGGTPGRGWVVVRSSKLDSEEICRNLEKGLFYASSGVELEDIVIESRHMTIIIKAQGKQDYKTVFIGDNGRILFSTSNNPAVFELNRSTKYVRAKVTDEKGRAAWIQPVFVR